MPFFFLKDLIKRTTDVLESCGPSSHLLSGNGLGASQVLSGGRPLPRRTHLRPHGILPHRTSDFSTAVCSLHASFCEFFIDDVDFLALASLFNMWHSKGRGMNIPSMTMCDPRMDNPSPKTTHPDGIDCRLKERRVCAPQIAMYDDRAGSLSLMALLTQLA